MPNAPIPAFLAEARDNVFALCCCCVLGRVGDVAVEEDMVGKSHGALATDYWARMPGKISARASLLAGASGCWAWLRPLCLGHPPALFFPQST